MYWIRILGALALASAVTLAGCSEDDVATVALSLTVNSFAPGETPTPIPGAEVCVADTDTCATAGSNGVAALELPADQEVALTVIGEGFNPTLVGLDTGATFVSEQATTMLSVGVATALAAILGIDYPPVGTGVTVTNVLLPLPDAGGMPGAALTLTNGSAAGYYVTAAGIPTYDLDATSSFGAAGFVDVPPGVAEVDIAGSPRDCVPVSTWPGANEASIRIPVREGFVTFGSVRCASVAVDVEVLASDSPFGETAPLPGAQVCQDGTENCITVDAQGHGVLVIPGNVEYAYEVSAGPEYFPVLSPQVSDSDMSLIPSSTLLAVGTIMAFATLLETQWPPTLGLVGMIVFEPEGPPDVGIPGVSFELTEGSGEPYYLNEANIPTTMLTETLDNGTGGFYEVTNGTVEIRVIGTDNCAPRNVWSGSASDRFRMPSRAGYLTVPVVRCDE